MSTTRRLLLTAHLSVLIVWIVLATVAYDALPARVPTHYDASGDPDGFMTRSVTSWFVLPVVGFVSALSFVISLIVVERHPKFVNVPDKQAFAALSADQRRPLTDLLGVCLTAISLAVTVFLATLHYDTWRVAQGEITRLSWLSGVTFALMLTTGVAGGILFSIRFNRLVNETQAAARASRMRSG